MRVKRTVYRGKVGTPKGGKWREVPLGNDAVAALKSLPRIGEWVFCRPGGGRMSAGQCRKPLMAIVAKAGLRHIGWHVLRHTFASHLAMRGVPIRHIQQLMGHSTIAMTERYAHLAPDVTRDAVRLLDTDWAPSGHHGRTAKRSSSRKVVRSVGIENTAPTWRVVWLHESSTVRYPPSLVQSCWPGRSWAPVGTT
jgi:hypothetical protein